MVGDTRRQVESERVEAVVASGSVEQDLLRALEVRFSSLPLTVSRTILFQDRDKTEVPVFLPLHDRSFDLVLLSNWEDQIIYQPDDIERLNVKNLEVADNAPSRNLTTPVNKALESGVWTQSIIWSPRAPFRDFTQLEFNHEDDVIPEERTCETPYLSFFRSALKYCPAETVRPRKRFRMDASQTRDKFNLSNDQFYEVSKEGGRHRVRQTFGQLSVEHAYPAQKLQLPFVRKIPFILRQSS